MTTHRNSKNTLSPTTPTPGVVVHTAADAAQPTPGAAAGTPVGPPPAPGTAHGLHQDGKAIQGAVQTFGLALQPATEVLTPYLGLIDPASRHRVGNLDGRKVTAMPLIVALLQRYPGLGTGITPDAATANLHAADAMFALAASLTALASHCTDTGRLLRSGTWTSLSPVYAAASTQARHDRDMALAVEPVAAALRLGPKAHTAPHTAAEAQRLATAAQGRATKAQQRATTARQHADRVAATSPVPLANPQGPAASADVAPQGPAPGR